MGEVINATLDRREVVARLLKDRGDLLVVTGLGSPSYDAMAAGDHDRNYYLWAAMGSAAMVGFGLAQAKPDLPVLVLTGDGEFMMGVGAIATIAVYKPKNLTIAILDNGQFGETGMQMSHTGHGIAPDKIAQSCGIPWTAAITNMSGVDDLRLRLQKRDGTKFATVKVKTGNPPRVLPPRDGPFIKTRFRSALGYKPI
jgi:thiamine pyrophosphate-dependent acetolactate synthase large subunit-like protein